MSSRLSAGCLQLGGLQKMESGVEKVGSGGFCLRESQTCSIATVVNIECALYD